MSNEEEKSSNPLAMDVSTMAEFVEKARAIAKDIGLSKHNYGKLRPGQAVFSTLAAIDPQFAKMIQGPESGVDPFHDNELIPAVLLFWGRTLVYRAKQEMDDPMYDGTDGAHPAWWRAHFYTAQKFLAGAKLLGISEEDMKAAVRAAEVKEAEERRGHS